VKQLQGMFAFGAWRQAARELVLARDPFGKKPLYYLRHGAFLAFASELRPLQHFPDLLGGIDPVALQEYLLLQYVHAPRTIYRHVRKLEPGTCLTIRFRPGKVERERVRRLFHFQPCEPRSWPWRRQPSEEVLAEECRRHLTEAVSDRLMADVPL